MEDEYKLPTVDHVDVFICAEIPNRNEDPELYTLVKDYMIHGPCGLANLSCPCMVDRKCLKGFPKKFQDHTTLDSNGFPVYRRRNDGATVIKNRIELDNRSVVPYNKKLLKRYQAHINVEWCNQAGSIKYLLKYINKGPDRATVVVVQGDNQNEEPSKDEIKEYYDCRYISAYEASWRIFSNEIENRCWEPRQKGKAIGRIHSVPPSFGEAYFLRILLNKVKGPKSFDDIRTVNGHVHDTFRDACYALGLLDDDTEYIEAIKEANETTTCSYIRVLFAMMLLSNTLSRPKVVWQSTWKYMTDDFIYRLRKFHRSEALSVPEDHLKNYAIGEIEKFLFGITHLYEDHGNEYESKMSMLNDEQRSVFEEILKVVDGDTCGVFFVYGYGGSGKTFLWKTLAATIRSKGQIVLNVASSGIASLLLTDSDTARLLRETKLIIWDEAPMVHKHAFEALDRTMNDIFNMDTSIGSEISFGGLHRCY
ncbi:uncharacterized protein LOC110881326 [Helianthus annuus]|uniref:uncharacterized protein LOC110881326 n=1 Tax=Helianthus annuus TaxID=4232 RepID=UPI000B9099CB|nr:uncharacterized protein LOC110881326 [Helianthus annuus]